MSSNMFLYKTTRRIMMIAFSESFFFVAEAVRDCCALIGRQLQVHRLRTLLLWSLLGVPLALSVLFVWPFFFVVSKINDLLQWICRLIPLPPGRGATRGATFRRAKGFPVIGDTLCYRANGAQYFLIRSSEYGCIFQTFLDFSGTWLLTTRVVCIFESSTETPSKQSSSGRQDRNRVQTSSPMRVNPLSAGDDIPVQSVFRITNGQKGPPLKIRNVSFRRANLRQITYSGFYGSSCANATSKLQMLAEIVLNKASHLLRWERLVVPIVSCALRRLIYETEFSFADKANEIACEIITSLFLGMEGLSVPLLHAFDDYLSAAQHTSMDRVPGWSDDAQQHHHRHGLQQDDPHESNADSFSEPFPSFSTRADIARKTILNSLHVAIFEEDRSFYAESMDIEDFSHTDAETGFGGFDSSHPRYIPSSSELEGVPGDKVGDRSDVERTVQYSKGRVGSHSAHDEMDFVQEGGSRDNEVAELLLNSAGPSSRKVFVINELLASIGAILGPETPETEKIDMLFVFLVEYCYLNLVQQLRTLLYLIHANDNGSGDGEGTLSGGIEERRSPAEDIHTSLTIRSTTAHSALRGGIGSTGCSGDQFVASMQSLQNAYQAFAAARAAGDKKALGAMHLGQRLNANLGYDSILENPLGPAPDSEGEVEGSNSASFCWSVVVARHHVEENSRLREKINSSSAQLPSRPAAPAIAQSEVLRVQGVRDRAVSLGEEEVGRAQEVERGREIRFDSHNDFDSRCRSMHSAEERIGSSANWADPRLSATPRFLRNSSSDEYITRRALPPIPSNPSMLPPTVTSTPTLVHPADVKVGPAGRCNRDTVGRLEKHSKSETSEASSHTVASGAETDATSGADSASSFDLASNLVPLTQNTSNSPAPDSSLASERSEESGKREKVVRKGKGRQFPVLEWLNASFLSLNSSAPRDSDSDDDDDDDESNGSDSSGSNSMGESKGEGSGSYDHGGEGEHGPHNSEDHSLVRFSSGVGGAACAAEKNDRTREGEITEMGERKALSMTGHRGFEGQMKRGVGFVFDNGLTDEAMSPATTAVTITAHYATTTTQLLHRQQDQQQQERQQQPYDLSSSPRRSSLRSTQSNRPSDRVSDSLFSDGGGDRGGGGGGGLTRTHRMIKSISAISPTGSAERRGSGGRWSVQGPGQQVEGVVGVLTPRKAAGAARESMSIEAEAREHALMRETRDISPVASERELNAATQLPVSMGDGRGTAGTDIRSRETVGGGQKYTGAWSFPFFTPERGDSQETPSSTADKSRAASGHGAAAMRALSNRRDFEMRRMNSGINSCEDMVDIDDPAENAQQTWIGSLQRSAQQKTPHPSTPHPSTESSPATQRLNRSSRKHYSGDLGNESACRFDKHSSAGAPSSTLPSRPSASSTESRRLSSRLSDRLSLEREALDDLLTLEDLAASLGGIHEFYGRDGASSRVTSYRSNPISAFRRDDSGRMSTDDISVELGGIDQYYAGSPYGNRSRVTSYRGNPQRVWIGSNDGEGSTTTPRRRWSAGDQMPQRRLKCSPWETAALAARRYTDLLTEAVTAAKRNVVKPAAPLQHSLTQCLKTCYVRAQYAPLDDAASTPREREKKMGEKCIKYFRLRRNDLVLLVHDNPLLGGCGGRDPALALAAASLYPFSSITAGGREERGRGIFQSVLSVAASMSGQAFHRLAEMLLALDDTGVIHDILLSPYHNQQEEGLGTTKLTSSNRNATTATADVVEAFNAMSVRQRATTAMRILLFVIVDALRRGSISLLDTLINALDPSLLADLGREKSTFSAKSDSADSSEREAMMRENSMEYAQSVHRENFDQQHPHENGLDFGSAASGSKLNNNDSTNTSDSNGINDVSSGSPLIGDALSSRMRTLSSSGCVEYSSSFAEEDGYDANTFITDVYSGRQRNPTSSNGTPHKGNKTSRTSRGSTGMVTSAPSSERALHSASSSGEYFPALMHPEPPTEHQQQCRADPQHRHCTNAHGDRVADDDMSGREEKRSRQTAAAMSERASVDDEGNWRTFIPISEAGAQAVAAFSGGARSSRLPPSRTPPINYQDQRTRDSSRMSAAGEKASRGSTSAAAAGGRSAAGAASRDEGEGMTTRTESGCGTFLSISQVPSLVVSTMAQRMLNLLLQHSSYFTFLFLPSTHPPLHDGHSNDRDVWRVDPRCSSAGCDAMPVERGRASLRGTLAEPSSLRTSSPPTVAPAAVPPEATIEAVIASSGSARSTEVVVRTWMTKLLQTVIAFLVPLRVRRSLPFRVAVKLSLFLTVYPAAYLVATLLTVSGICPTSQCSAGSIAPRSILSRAGSFASSSRSDDDPGAISNRSSSSSVPMATVSVSPAGSAATAAGADSAGGSVVVSADHGVSPTQRSDVRTDFVPKTGHHSPLAPQQDASTTTADTPFLDQKPAAGRTDLEWDGFLSAERGDPQALGAFSDLVLSIVLHELVAGYTWEYTPPAEKETYTRTFLRRASPLLPSRDTASANEIRSDDCVAGSGDVDDNECDYVEEKEPVTSGLLRSIFGTSFQKTMSWSVVKGIKEACFWSTVAPFKPQHSTHTRTRDDPRRILTDAKSFCSIQDGALWVSAFRPSSGISHYMAGLSTRASSFDDNLKDKQHTYQRAAQSGRRQSSRSACERKGPSAGDISASSPHRLQRDSSMPSSLYRAPSSRLSSFPTLAAAPLSSSFLPSGSSSVVSSPSPSRRRISSAVRSRRWPPIEYAFKEQRARQQQQQQQWRDRRVVDQMVRGAWEPYMLSPQNKQDALADRYPTTPSFHGSNPLVYYDQAQDWEE